MAARTVLAKHLSKILRPLELPCARRRLYSTAASGLKVGYVPEHFSTPLFFAQSEGYYKDVGLSPEFKPFLTGTGDMIKALKENDIDMAVGLTEGWVAGLGNRRAEYKIVGTYVQSPLRWAISTGDNREDIQSIADLQGKCFGVSRLGSGSYVMAFVLARQQGWPGNPPVSFNILGTFKNLRAAVRDREADAFMWEYFTSKKYYDNNEIKYIGSIYTPWPSWTITAADSLLNNEPNTRTIGKFFSAVNKGIQHFRTNPEKAVDYISTNLDYTAEDAREWMKTVNFADDVSVVDRSVIIDKTFTILNDANVIENAEAVDPKTFVIDTPAFRG
ncbi:uncharacterized protein V1513DRAFT_402317 [Lipomyces chichibuensis]|uniref:uncharacterized protein n=1 Tax=Lipomyces chichibuensis TaxID=1546026 RepID=UPI0033432D27